MGVHPAQLSNETSTCSEQNHSLQFSKINHSIQTQLAMNAPVHILIPKISAPVHVLIPKISAPYAINHLINPLYIDDPLP